MHKRCRSQGASHAASCHAVPFPPFFDSSFRGLHTPRSAQGPLNLEAS